MEEEGQKGIEKRKEKEGEREREGSTDGVVDAETSADVVEKTFLGGEGETIREGAEVLDGLDALGLLLAVSDEGRGDEEVAELGVASTRRTQQRR